MRFGILLLEALPERSNHFRKPVSIPGHLSSSFQRPGKKKKKQKKKKEKEKKISPQSDCDLPENV
jgi:hypothetical protein